MNIADIMGVIQKGIGFASAALNTGNQELAKKGLDAVANVAKPPEEVTEAILEDTETTLDELLAEFNAPLPEKSATA